MSTRCTVWIKKNENRVCQFYHHFDGYPSGVGAELHEFVKSTNKIDDENQLFYCLNAKFGGYENQNVSVVHGDLEYEYEIDIDSWCVKCWEIIEKWDQNNNYKRTHRRLY